MIKKINITIFRSFYQYTLWMIDEKVTIKVGIIIGTVTATVGAVLNYVFSLLQ